MSESAWKLIVESYQRELKNATTPEEKARWQAAIDASLTEANKREIIENGSIKSTPQEKAVEKARKIARAKDKKALDDVPRLIEEGKITAFPGYIQTTEDEIIKGEIKSNPIEKSIEESEPMTAAQRRQAAIDRGKNKKVTNTSNQINPSSARNPEERQAILEANEARKQAIIDATKARDAQRRQPIIEAEDSIADPSHLEPPPEELSGPRSSISFGEESIDPSHLEPPPEYVTGERSNISFGETNTSAPISEGIEFLDDDYFNSLIDPELTVLEEDLSTLGEDVAFEQLAKSKKKSLSQSKKPSKTPRPNNKKTKKVKNFTKEETTALKSSERLEALDSTIVPELTKNPVGKFIEDVIHNPESTFNQKGMGILDQAMGFIADTKGSTAPALESVSEYIPKATSAVKKRNELYWKK